MTYKTTALLIAVCFVAAIIALVRRQRLNVLYTYWWTFSAAAVLALGIFPQMLDHVGHYLGISYPPILAIVVALCMLFVKVLTMDIERTRQEKQIRILAQRMAAYEAQLNEMGRQDVASKAK